MIIRHESGTLEFYRQTAHAELAGFIAGAIGAPGFIRPDAEELRVVRMHDMAWDAPDEAPAVLPGGSVRDFLRMPAEEAASIWSASIGQVHAQLGAASAVAASRHFIRLANQGLASNNRPPEDMRHFEAFIERQQAFARRLAGHYSPSEAARMAALLHAGDTISVLLLICGECRRYMTSEPVEGLREDGAAAAFQFAWPRERTMAVAPWPFREESLELAIACRVLPDRSYQTDSDLRESLARAPEVRRLYHLRQG